MFPNIRLNITGWVTGQCFLWMQDSRYSLDKSRSFLSSKYYRKLKYQFKCLCIRSFIQSVCFRQATSLSLPGESIIYSFKERNSHHHQQRLLTVEVWRYLLHLVLSVIHPFTLAATLSLKLFCRPFGNGKSCSSTQGLQVFMGGWLTYLPLKVYILDPFYIIFVQSDNFSPKKL